MSTATLRNCRGHPHDRLPDQHGIYFLNPVSRSIDFSWLHRTGWGLFIMLSGFMALLFRFSESVRLMGGLDWLIVGLVVLNLSLLSIVVVRGFVS